MLINVGSSLNIFNKKIKQTSEPHQLCDGLSMNALNVVHRRFKPWSAQIKDLNQYFLRFQDRKAGKRTTRKM
jgi:hypothetical protein